MPDKNQSNWRQALSLLGQLGYVIAIPLVILALIGRFVDRKLHSSPWFLLTGIFIALIVSTFWVLKKTTEIMKDIPTDKKDKKEDNNKENKDK